MSVAIVSAMAATETLPRTPFTPEHLSPAPSAIPKPIPILTTPTNGSSNPIPPSDPMDITPTSASMPPPTSSPPSETKAERKNSAELESNAATNTNGGTNEGNANGANQSLGAAAAASQPTKVVQTAFIHKLYNMLEDPTIQHLISWSNSNESFVMSPSTDFSKVLAQYFKHTNISSFVRQLNMYGFHKVSDVFHNGAPDNTLWEFRHGNGSFKRGDLMGLKEIKRRASRHTLIHRDSFSTTSKSLAPAQPIQPPSEMPAEASTDRLTLLEHSVWEMRSRLALTEDTVAYLKGRCQILSEGILRCHRWNQDLAGYLSSAVPDPDSSVHRNISMMQQDIARQTDILRNGDMADLSPENRQPGHPIFSNHLHEAGPPLSPRQMPLADNNQRRPSHPSIFDSRPPPAASFRGLAPHLSISPRRYGSIGAANPSNTYSPSTSRAPPPPPPPPPPTALTIAQPQPQYPVAAIQSPTSNLSRRHTAADIRSHGWDHSQGPPLPSPFANAQPSTPQWPSSPARGGGESQAIREALSSYELGRGTSNSISTHARTPPPHDPAAAVAGTGPESAWQVPGSRYPGYGRTYGATLDPTSSGGPPTRRSSMASNLHGLLNPAGESVAEEDGEGSAAKRKRVG